VGVAVALFILISGVKLVRETVDPLLGRAPDPEMVTMILQRVQQYPGVLGTHDLMIHDYGPGRQFASVHVEMAAEVSILESHDVIDNIEREFLAREGIHLIAHLDPVVTSDPHVAEVRDFLVSAACEIHENLTIHDLRLVPGATHTNVIFDCVVPSDVGISHSEICGALREKVSRRFADHFCVITIDENYTGQ
jgi:Co/Zn/Cd efflux system component